MERNCKALADRANKEMDQYLSGFEIYKLRNLLCAMAKNFLKVTGTKKDLDWHTDYYDMYGQLIKSLSLVFEINPENPEDIANGMVDFYHSNNVNPHQPIHAVIYWKVQNHINNRTKSHAV